MRSNKKIIGWRKITKLLESIIFTLDKDNVELCAQSTINIFTKEFPFSFYLLVCRYVYSVFKFKKHEPIIYLNYLQLIENIQDKKELSNPKIISCFCKFLVELKTQESYYILGKMIGQKLIEPHFRTDLKVPYFLHYKTKEVISNI